MATRYLSRVLRGLDDVFKFRPSQKGAPEEIEIDLPVQMVLDVGEYASYGSGRFGTNFGWWIMSTQNVHVIVGSLLQTLRPDLPIQALNGYEAGWNRDDFMLWVYRTWITGTESLDFSTAEILLEQSATTIGPAGTNGPVTSQLLFSGNRIRTTAVVPFPVINLEGPVEQMSMPVPLIQREDGSNAAITFASTADSGGTITVTFNVLFWLGPKGALPPRI